MLAVNITSSLKGTLDHRDGTDVRTCAEKWWTISEVTLKSHADQLLAVADNHVAGVFTVHGFHHDPQSNDKVVFELTEDDSWHFLLGSPSPVTWSRGQANPVRKVDAATAAELHQRRSHQLAEHGWTLDVTSDGRSATVRAPHGALALTAVQDNTAQLTVLNP